MSISKGPYHWVAVDQAGLFVWTFLCGTSRFCERTSAKASLSFRLSKLVCFPRPPSRAAAWGRGSGASGSPLGAAGSCLFKAGRCSWRSHLSRLFACFYSYTKETSIKVNELRKGYQFSR